MPDKLTPTAMQETDSDKMLDYQHAYLWSAPGTGKTLTTLRAFTKGGYKRGVVVGPPLSLGMWQEEIVTQLGLVAKIMRGGVNGYKPERLEALYDSDWLVTTYGLAGTNRAVLNKFLQGAESVLVLDEAHALKSRGAQRTQHIFGEATLKPRPATRKLPEFTPKDSVKAGGIAANAVSVWQLTGTPQTRWADDLWTQLSYGRYEVLKAYNVETYDKFLNAFCVLQPMKLPNGRTMERITGNKNSKMLLKLLNDCKIVRRTLNEAAAELPPITHRELVVPVKLSDTLPQINLDRLMAELADPGSPYAKQYHLLGEAKASAVADYVLEAHDGPMLVGFWHRDVGDAIVKKLRKYRKKWNIAYVDGGVSATSRDLIRDSFNLGGVDVLVGQMSAMNTSWNLQKRGRHVVIAEQLPSPGMLEQFYSRVYRKGQANHVQVDHILSDHSLDVMVKRIRNRKAKGISETVNATR